MEYLKFILFMVLIKMIISKIKPNQQERQKSGLSLRWEQFTPYIIYVAGGWVQTDSSEVFTDRGRGANPQV